MGSSQKCEEDVLLCKVRGVIHFANLLNWVGTFCAIGSSRVGKSMVPYSIQWLMRLRPAWFRHDLLVLLDLLKQRKIKPVIAKRLPLEEARYAHEMLGQGGVPGKIVLLPNG
jgi:NADPH:quinone reductase-like Zn-dependent oxidoreductase